MGCVDRGVSTVNLRLEEVAKGVLRVGFGNARG